MTRMLALIGAVLVTAVLTGAVASGLVTGEPPSRAARGLLAREADGWTVQVDDEGRFRVELPDDRTREVVEHPAPDDRRLTAWTANVGQDARVIAGWATVNPPVIDGTLAATASHRYLRDTVLDRWLDAHQLSAAFVTVREGGVGGVPAVTVRTTQPRPLATSPRPGSPLAGREAYAEATFALDGSTLYVLETVTIYRDAVQLDRLAESFAVT
jgi:hypothetical protein